MAEEDRAGGGRKSEDFEKGADGGAEVVGGKIAFGMDAVGKREGLSQIGRIAAESAVAALGGHGGVVRQGFKESRICFGQLEQHKFVHAGPCGEVLIALACEKEPTRTFEGEILV